MKTSEEIKNFMIAHPEIKSMSKNGWFPASLVKTAVNPKNEYTFDEQQDAFKKIYDTVKLRYAGKDFNASEKAKKAGKFFNDFTAMFDNDDVNEDDWQLYDNKQMSKLADKMGYNWKNLDDRSAMMKRLQDKTIRREKVKAYEEDKKNSPVSTFVTEMLAPNITTRLSKGEDIKGRDIALDALNTGTMLVPSVGGKKAAFALLASDVAQSVGTGFNTGAIDKDVWNDKADLGKAIGFPVVGHAAGKSTELLKKLGDIVKGSLEATQIGGKVLDNTFDPILDALTDTKAVARKNANADIKNFNDYEKFLDKMFLIPDMKQISNVSDNKVSSKKLDKIKDLYNNYSLEQLNNTNKMSKFLKDPNSRYNHLYSNAKYHNDKFAHKFDVSTSKAGALPYEQDAYKKLKDKRDIAQNALDYLDESSNYQKISDEDKHNVIEFLEQAGMRNTGNTMKEHIQSGAKLVSKPLIEGPAAKYMYRDDAIKEKNERIKKQAEEIVNNKGGAVYNYYKGRPNDLTEEEIEILKAAEVL